MTDLNEMLARVLDLGASDLHITAGLPFMMRIDGKLVPMDSPCLTPEDTKRLLYSILTEEQREIVERRWEHGCRVQVDPERDPFVRGTRSAFDP